MTEFPDSDQEMTGGGRKITDSSLSEKSFNGDNGDDHLFDSQEDGIIELTDSVWQDEDVGFAGPEPGGATDSSVLDTGEDVDDDFIELLELSDDQDFQDEDPDGKPFRSQRESDDPVIDLTDVTMNGDSDESVIELTDIAMDGMAEDSGIKPASAEAASAAFTPMGSGSSSGLEEIPDTHQETARKTPLVSGQELLPEQLEAALIKVIEEKYSETIEKLLLESVNKVLENKISELKQTILNDLRGADT